jgi:hypothetical protein
MKKLTIPGLLLLLTGCETARECSLTYKLWNNSDLSRFAEPAPEPHLALYAVPAGNDVLVQYDEAHENKESTRRRAYFLARNLKRITERKKPRFADPQIASRLERIAMDDGESGLTNSTAMPKGSYHKESREFSLSGIPGLDGRYALPVYEETSGDVTRAALTPLTVTGDTLIVGAVAGVLAAYAYAYSGGGWGAGGTQCMRR